MSKKNIFIIIILLVLVLVGFLFVFSSSKENQDLSQKEDLNVLENINQEDEGENDISESLKQEEVNKNESNIINQEENKKIMQAILQTNKGDITIEFDTRTPKTVENFIKLAKEGFYDGTKFHRVIKGFMNQGGDPLTKDDTKMAYWGTGGPGYKFEDEISATNKNDAYTVAMANAGPNTNGSQFFINVVNNNYLDPQHTVFAKVVSGKEVVDLINNTKTDQSARPVEPVIINKVILK